MSVPQRPEITRLRWVSSKDKNVLVQWTRAIRQRIQIYEIAREGGKWVLWFVPGDHDKDLRSGDLDA